MTGHKTYRINIDNRWSLEDLYVFPRTYEQVYFAVESLIEIEDEADLERINRAFLAFPWMGGYSAVNFYNQLKFATPPNRRPAIKEMKYASPGYIDLILNLPLAVQFASSVASIAGSIGVCNAVYNQIHSGLQRRKLLRMEVERKRLELSQAKLDYVLDSSEKLAKIMGLPSAQALHARTFDPLISLKILLSIYRRLRKLAEFKNRHKADLTLPIPDKSK